jgi:hypothetical protein
MKNKYAGLVVMLSPEMDSDQVEAIAKTFGMLQGVTTLQMIDSSVNTDGGAAGREILRILDIVKNLMGGS